MSPDSWTLRTFTGIALLLLAYASLLAADAEDFPRGKLPAGITPTHYALDLTVDPTQPRFAGVATIDVDLAGPTTHIWLHGLDLAVSEASVRVGDATRAARYTPVDTISGVARLDVDAALPAGKAQLRIAYSAAFRDGSEGLNRVKAGDDWYAFTQMEPIDARRAFPGFDEPRFKTPFVVTVTTPGANKVIANAPLASSTPAGNGLTKHVFEPTLPLPTYLIALAVGPLDVVDAPPIPPTAIRSKPLAVRGVATRGQGARLAFTLRETPEILTRLEDYFGIAFPYPKLDLIASPQQAGAMENAGAIIYADPIILLGPDAPPQQQRSFGETHAHEIAHHWFGDLVTPQWWDDIWLNESFAEWMGVKISDAWRPAFGIKASLTDSALQAMTLDSNAAGRPVRQSIDDNTQIGSVFDSITYQKGGAILSMVESYLGEDTFRRGVREHIAAHPHGNATADDFFGALAHASNQPAIVDAFRSFVLQPGVPLLTVKIARDGKSLAVSQSRYVPLGSTVKSEQRWKIPFCATLYAKAESRKVCSLVTDATANIVLPAGFRSDAVMPNAGGAGYYRFALEPAALDRLVARADTLPESEALALADSVLAAYTAGRLSFDAVLRTTVALSRHPARAAATKLAFDLLEGVDRQLTPTQSAALRAKIRAAYAPRLAALGYDAGAGVYAKDAADRQLLRRTLMYLVAIQGRDPQVRRSLAAAAKASLDDPAALDPALRDRAWIVGVQDLGKPFFDALEKRFAASQDPLERGQIVGALARADDPALAASARALALQPTTRVNELYGVVFGQMNDARHRDAAWQWAQVNIDALLGRLPGFAQPFLFELPSGMCAPDRRTEIERLFAPKVKSMGKGELELARTLETVDLCIAQKTAHAADVKRVLGN